MTKPNPAGWRIGESDSDAFAIQFVKADLAVNEEHPGTHERCVSGVQPEAGCAVAALRFCGASAWGITSDLQTGQRLRASRPSRGLAEHPLDRRLTDPRDRRDLPERATLPCQLEDPFRCGRLDGFD
jgi:hypothetical protein